MKKILNWPVGLFHSLFARFARNPGTTTIDVSGVLWSDFIDNVDGILEDRGWVKGWLLQPDIAVVTRHSNPSAGQHVHFYAPNGTRVERHIVDTEVLNIGGLTNYQNYGDTVLVRLNKALPANISRYEIGRAVDKGKAYAYTKLKDWSPSLVSVSDQPYLYGIRRHRKDQIVYGSSGLPWFQYIDKRWKVISHSHRGGPGYGPAYGHPVFQKTLKAGIDNLVRRARKRL